LIREFFLKEKVTPVSLTVSHKGELFALMGRDKIIRIFDVSTARIRRKIDESTKVLINLFQIFFLKFNILISKKIIQFFNKIIKRLPLRHRMKNIQITSY